ncbi:hypothetical protein CPAST_c07470 [Clostridium pasteurianum DSM 525 = ATCC 6013]|uniref:Uncharacterized protein n=1 Tax=Clostridium pasteurianum DSM 525 = ATCC 6013 TaxID=1262449 RepID=A0A0H3J268_CLOPA|nr:hypothetical protein [Clostridium pasteurianum]AJA46847.1 hypothetical protein CPAST_c07470 [Clostridium pasteurianum DSM 525 = ATCC 6013]AJA50835.1 hypothetical protein CLPA_c07470 [Clostridium pasteurianum DSM 525 = ATCC 6013]AOZ74236.1 hypothetical protein AQ983_03600 [Clostridium pasteurianum DSM 525 = ATCC 6013]AOZ78034.1 hypothetical protein AQ984_03600 [Clostridium pasteurianum]ELP58540.1 hypothetical protein F502_13700 [Clostridium pasteurianum DSM 525 = ATCC 6013]
MKYFTDELWCGINSESEKERESASDKWEINLEEYCNIFENVKKLLPKKFLKIYMDQEGFHDYNLKNFEIIHGENGYKDPVSVSIVISNKEHTWNIIYNKIKKIAINYEQEFDIYERKRRKYRGFDDYGYDEFFQIDEKTLSHEILFASGATILVHFEKISIVEIKN